MTASYLARFKRRMLEAISLHAAITTPITAGLLERERLRLLTSSKSKAATMLQLTPITSLTVPAMLSAADGMDLLSPCREVIPWHLVEKASSGLRKVVCPPLRIRVGQALALDLLRAQFTPGGHIFNWRGRGCPRHVAAIKECLETYGQYVIIADIRECHASVNVDALYNYEFLPSELIRYSLDHRQLSFGRLGAASSNDDVGLYSVPDREQADPRGLLEGGAASDALLALLLNDLPDHLPRNSRAFVFSDNIVVVSTSASASTRALNALVRYLTEHPGGPFSIRSQSCHARDGFEHTGYQFQAASDGTVDIALSHSNALRSVTRLMQSFRPLSTQALSQIDPRALAREILTAYPALGSSDREMLMEEASLYITGMLTDPPVQNEWNSEPDRSPQPEGTPDRG